jgi:PIN domain nuclease of toxin-antitoxin system
VNARVEYVLDSTALIALLTLEPGHQKVNGLLDRSVVGAVNLAETVHKLVQRGSVHAELRRFFRELELTVEDWSGELAYRSAEFALLERSHGLSLGDRACLTLAKHLRATAVTADRAWSRIPKLGVPIMLFR